MDVLLAFALGLALGLIIHLMRIRRPAEPRLVPGSPETRGAATEAPESAVDPRSLRTREEIEAYFDAALAGLFERSPHPRQVLESDLYQQAQQALARPPFDPAELPQWFADDRRALHLAAVGPALQADPNAAEPMLLAAMGIYSPWWRYIAVAELSKVHPAPEPWLHQLCAQLDRSWLNENELRVLREFFLQRRAAGEEPPSSDAWDPWCDELRPEQYELLRDLLIALGPAAAQPWLSRLWSWSRKRSREQADGSAARAPGEVPGIPTMPEDDPLHLCGRLWTEDADEVIEREIPHPDLQRAVDRLLRMAQEKRPRPIMVVGPPRTGKTVLIRAVMRELLRGGWTILEAAPDQINAGMSFVGQLEARVAKLARALRPGERRLWVVPDASDLMRSGSARGDEGRSIGRMLRHDFEAREIVLLGECGRAEWEAARTDSPWLSVAFDVVEGPVFSEDETIGLVRSWTEEQRRGGQPALDATLLREAWELTRQFLDESQRPGNLFDTVRRALEVRDRDHPQRKAEPLQREDLLESLAHRTGLPLDLLDPERALDLEAIEGFFKERIRGQDEAVRSLLDRLAMIKAGVNDPSRPLGVFLFAGPSGTGKTELAKTLATWLFGSAARLVRLDMSELKDGGLDAILGSARERRGDALIDRIRREPFSVVLLDEFEKAHPEVWDLFLQVFDDGRLSDRQGRVADFRHCIILLTTNVGSRVETRAGVGFSARAAGFRENVVLDAIHATFRPELLNRLDRVVVFRPFSRAVMREILQLQIDIAIRRRGLRDRPWAAEWDPSALELLLDQGFSEELGARPLQRAIEQHLLVPLARILASQKAPKGDQFLFLRAAGDGLVIDFVDPDASAEIEEPFAGAAAVQPAGQGAMALALDARGTRGELLDLEQSLEELESLVGHEDWQEEQQAILGRTASDGFWDSPSRFETLDLYEHRDRVQRAVRSARSLLDRLAGAGREQIPVHPLQQLALRLHLLRTAAADLQAQHPREAVLLVQARASGTTIEAECVGFAWRLVDMYRSWARRRGMTLSELHERSASRPGRWAAVVQGFGMWSLLQPESGLHVLELPTEEGRRALRHAVRVQLLALATQGPNSVSLVEAALREPEAGTTRTIVRRYREQPSPLVRDAARGWRTGRLDRVYAGDFDLLAGAEPGLSEAGEEG